METANKLTYLSTKFFTENKEEYRITVTVSLDDDCRSNMCDWSVTADVRWKNQRGQFVARNPKLRNLLEDDEYIPSLGQLNLMAHHMDELNKAFAYVSASPLSSARYWSSTECSKVSA